MTIRQRTLSKTIHGREHATLRQLMVEARKKAGLTQQDVARKLKRPQSFVAKYEGGERRLDVIEFLTIAKAIGADPVRLMKRLIGPL